MTKGRDQMGGIRGGPVGKTSSPLVHPSIDSTSRPLVSTRSQNLSTIPSPLFSKDLNGSQLRKTREQRG